uniref:CSON003369 protein n=1 Tax=Culicoides sonorensis TaxID=179676 RepID=A0A336LCB9_CULSO
MASKVCAMLLLAIAMFGGSALAKPGYAQHGYVDYYHHHVAPAPIQYVEPSYVHHAPVQYAKTQQYTQTYHHPGGYADYGHYDYY